MITTFIIAFTSFLAGSMLTWYRYSKPRRVLFPEVERAALLLLLSNSSLKDIKNFAASKVNYLSEKTFGKLCAKIEELNADELLNEDSNILKVRISSMEDKEVELKKLQAESFIETIKTLKTMCTGGKRR